MTRLWLALFGKVVLLCALALGAIRAYPREDAELYALLAAPDGCAAPCFMGIRPGETTRDEALAILRAYPYIDQIEDDATGISWRWSRPPQLGFLPGGSPGAPVFARIDYSGATVVSIHMETSITWGDFLLLFGSPDQVASTNIHAPSVRYHMFGAVYREQAFEIQTMTRCPINSPQAMWYSTVYMVWPVVGLVRGGQAETVGSC